MRLDYFPETIYLPMPPLQSVAPIAPVVIGGVKYLDAAGVEQTLTENTDYLVDTYSEPGRITPAYGEVWPPIYPVPNAVRIVYKAGYGDAATSVPAAIKNWIKAMVGSLWENRETAVVTPSTLTLVNLGFLDGSWTITGFSGGLLRAGKLRRRLVIQQATETQGATGEMAVTWGTFATVYGSVEPLRGREYFAAKEQRAEVTTRIRIRYRTGSRRKCRCWMARGFS